MCVCADITVYTRVPILQQQMCVYIYDSMPVRLSSFVPHHTLGAATIVTQGRVESRAENDNNYKNILIS